MRRPMKRRNASWRKKQRRRSTRRSSQRHFAQLSAVPRSQVLVSNSGIPLTLLPNFSGRPLTLLPNCSGIPLTWLHAHVFHEHGYTISASVVVRVASASSSVIAEQAKRNANSVISKMTSVLTGMESISEKPGFADVAAPVRKPFVEKMNSILGMITAAKVVLRDEDCTTSTADMKDIVAYGIGRL